MKTLVGSPEPPEEPEYQAPYVYTSTNTDAFVTESSIVNNASLLTNSVIGVSMKVSADSECTATEDKKHVWADMGSATTPWCMACGNWTRIDLAVPLNPLTIAAKIQAFITELEASPLRQTNTGYVLERVREFLE